ncbi:MAG: hypothetical protein D3M94_18710 [Rhodocyclales bacterium GT-UBC]|nr:MAG: hypothetical protein D3M94_18710 [Rhodocyclales bacterium GT-UBC]
MCQDDEPTALPISQGAALAHGCCGGFRRRPVAAQIIPWRPEPAGAADAKPEQEKPFQLNSGELP